LSVADQLRRIETGRTAQAAIDYDFLRFDSGRYGRAALQKLAGLTTGTNAAAIAAKAAEALARESRWPRLEAAAPRTPAEIAARITVYPAGQSLPASFLGQDWSRDAGLSFSCLHKAGACDAFL